MNIINVTVGPVITNCYIIWQEGSGKAIVADPGDHESKIEQKLEELGLECELIILTHGHFDHISAVDGLRSKTGARVYVGEAEKQLLADSNLNYSQWVRRPVEVIPDRLLKDGEQFEAAGIRFKTIFTPGHTVGSVCYYCEEEKVLLSGDTLFMMGVGRTDLPTGDSAKLYASITDKIMKLPDDIRVYPGHGQVTTIGNERRNF